MTTKKDDKTTKIVTPEIVCSFPHLFTPSDPFDSGDPKYSLKVLIPKSDKGFAKKMKSAIDAAAFKKWEGKAKEILEKAKDTDRYPVKDGDNTEDELAQGCWVLSAKSKSRPGVVDSALNPIMDIDEIYPGCIIRASLNFYGYDFKGSKGVAVGLNNVMKVKDGDRLGGKESAESDFAEFASDEPINQGEEEETVF